MRALVVSNMLPDAAHPERGRFVRDQVSALRAIDGLEVELYEFAPGARALARAAGELGRRFVHPARSRPGRGERVDIVHAHFGLSFWPALPVPAHVRALTLHGSDVHHPRTRLATRAALPLVQLLAVVSPALVRELPGRAARRRAQVLPCGADLTRFRRIARVHARGELGLELERPYLLFPADPARGEKRHDRALALARSLGVELLALGGVDPERVPLWVNAASAVIIPSEREGFGLAAVEALACDVPVLATPVGIHQDLLAGVKGTLCAPFELARWQAVIAPHIREQDPRVPGRARAERFSAPALAERVAAAWRAAREHAG